jgi:hypothetical protein
MNWRRSFYLSFIPLFVFLTFLLSERPQGPERPGTRKLASDPAAKRPGVRKSLTPKVVAAVRGRADQDPFLRNRLPQSVEATLVRDPAVTVSKGFELVRDVAALPRKEFRLELGEVLKETDDLVFFRTREPRNHIPVAISRQTGALFPISKVLHVSDATAAVREALLRDGYAENYYHPRIRFLSIRSPGTSVLDAYDQLTRRGYKVRLEVLRPRHQIF